MKIPLTLYCTYGIIVTWGCFGMQTFLPYPDFAISARCLDETRLKNQINEALIVWRTLTGYYAPGKGWPHHSTTRMWRGYENALAHYHNACLREYLGRGKRWNGTTLPDHPVTLPPWFGNEALHASHRSNLLRKAPDWYSQFGWTEGPDLAYVWPV